MKTIAIENLTPTAIDVPVLISKMNVYDYFVQRIGIAPGEASFRNLPIDTPCGEECREAIDAACVFLNHARQANPAICESIIEDLESIIEIYWCG